jgi:hypothetical protein
MAPKTQNPKAKGWKTNVRNLTDTTKFRGPYRVRSSVKSYTAIRVQPVSQVGPELRLFTSPATRLQHLDLGVIGVNYR